jgi:hypothetical protein
VKEKLGYDGPITSIIESEFPGSQKIVYDDTYMTLEIVINWAADHSDYNHWGGGVILCFLHAVIDIDPVADNDERHKTGWTNWCGTPLFEREVSSLVSVSGSFRSINGGLTAFGHNVCVSKL